ncbi:NBS-LRR type disease resistance protein [Melia azedarach]|uniref:NBS-LRR type disease resistance protein n=1 Tax=Melia azedarach TaxID=155640 RepID=A0ACC1Y4H9_MELAZ|nr:NBS-LRR type disease resistance protein [Melia azedarach]
MGNCFTATATCDINRCFEYSRSNRATYICKLEDNLETLQTELRKLVELKNDVKRKVLIAEEQQQMKRTEQVQGWISRVEELEAEVGELQKVKSEYVKKLYPGGCCSDDCQSTYKYGKKVAKKLQVVATMRKEASFKELVDRVPENAQ